MNKFFNISILALLLLGVSLASCSHEEKDIFDKNSAERLSDVLANYSNILTDKGGKWALQYFTTEKEQGYVYLFTFKKDGSVDISGNNTEVNRSITGNPKAVGNMFATRSSQWEIIGDNGPVLSLNSYNPVFHVFADPAPNNEGHKGDYEFDLMKFSGDTLYLEGKKHGTNMIMVRLASDVDDETYLNEVVEMSTKFFDYRMPVSYVNLPGGYRYRLSNGATSIMDLCPETGDPITQTKTYNSIISHDGLAFMKPITLYDSIAHKAFTIQHFTRQEDGTLLCTDDGKTTITADYLSGCLSDKDLAWTISQLDGKMTGDFLNVFNNMLAGMKKYHKSSLKNMTFGYNAKLGIYEFSFDLTYTPNKKKITVPAIIRCEMNKVDKDQIKFTFAPFVPEGLDDRELQPYQKGAEWFENVPAFKQWLDKLSGVTFKLTAGNVLAPLTIVMTDATSSDFITVDIKK